MQKKYFITEYLSNVTLCIPGLWASHALSKGGLMTPHLVCLEQGAGLSQVSRWWMGILEQVLKRNGPAGHSLREEHEAVKGSRLFRLGESLGLSVGWQRGCLAVLWTP